MHAATVGAGSLAALSQAAARQSGPMPAAPRQLGGFGCAARTSAAFTGAAAAAAELNPCARYGTEMRTRAHKGRLCWLTRCSVTGSSAALRAYACSTQATWGLWVCSTHKCLSRLGFSRQRFAEIMSLGSLPSRLFFDL